MQSVRTRTLVCTASQPRNAPPRLRRCEFQLNNLVFQNRRLRRTDTWRQSATPKGFSGVRRKETVPERGEEELGGRGGGGAEMDEIPQEVLERMLVRIVASVGVPAAAGLGLMHVFGVVKQQGLWDVPVWVVVPTTFSCLAASALGVAYGGLSTSWDPDRKGSLIGLEEAQKNWADLWKDDPEEM